MYDTCIFQAILGRRCGCSCNWVSSWSARGWFSHRLNVCVACHTYSELYKGFSDLCISKESSQLIQGGGQQSNSFWLSSFNLGWTSEKCMDVQVMQHIESLQTGMSVFLLEGSHLTEKLFLITTDILLWCDATSTGSCWIEECQHSLLTTAG